MCSKRTPKVSLCCLLIIHIQISGYTVLSRTSPPRNYYKIMQSTVPQATQDQTNSRTNTLFDDADDIQRQLDNEARDRIKFGRPKTIWVFHFPTHFSEHSTIESPIESPIDSPINSPIDSSIDSPIDSAINGQLKRFRREYNSYFSAIVRRHQAASTPSMKSFFRQMLKKEKDGEDCDVSCALPAAPPDWSYSNQANWAKSYPECGGRSQSPVELPIAGLINARGARNLLFHNHDILPKTLTLVNDGRQVVLYGEWKSDQRPLIYGGAAHSRRYLFHSLTVHLPSEHTVAGLIYPVETQALFVSAEYNGMDEALGSATSDPQAILGVASLYKYADHTHKGLDLILSSAKGAGLKNVTLKPQPLSFFNPPFTEYACYQGSLTMPPCTESVLWIVRGRALSIQREMAETGLNLLVSDADPGKHIFFRSPLPLNDRKVYLFK